jgi:hypothetical protein
MVGAQKVLMQQAVWHQKSCLSCSTRHQDRRNQTTFAKIIFLDLLQNLRSNQTTFNKKKIAFSLSIIP